MSNTPPFRQLICDPNRSPGWMRRRFDGGLLEPIGNAHAHFFSIDTYNMLAGLPGFATETTIRAIGQDRHVLLFPEESFESQIQRCREWLDSAKDAGLPIGVMRQIQLMWAPAVPRVRLVYGNSAHAYWFTLDPDGTFSALRRDPTNWDWDSAWSLGAPEPPFVHRYFPIVYAPDGVTEHDLDPSAEGTLGSPNVTQRFGLNIAALARYMARAGAALWGWILAFDPDSFDPEGDNGTMPGGYPDGDWFRAYTIGGEFNRLQTARYYELKAPLE